MKKAVFFLFMNISVYAQVGIGTTSPNAALDIFASNEGILIPRVSLTARNVSTVLTPTVSELVYNTNTSGSSPNQVTPGFYYWDGINWQRLNTGAITIPDGSETKINSGTNVNISGLGTVASPYVINSPIETASLTPSNSIVASATNVAVPSTNVQGAISDLSAAIKLADENIYKSNGSLTSNRILTQGSNNLTFSGTGNTLYNAGNVGVGTLSPLGKLNISGSTVIGSGSFTGSTGGIPFSYGNTSNSALWFGRYNNTSSNDYGLIYLEGTGDTAKLNILAGDNADGAGADDSVFIGNVNYLGAQKGMTIKNGKVGIETSTIRGQLDVNSTNDGVLIPRVALTALNSVTGFLTPTASELVYNTATSGSGINQVTPGYYYMNPNANGWIRIATGNDENWKLAGNSDTDPAINFLGTTNNFAFRFRTNNLERFEVTNGSTTSGGRLRAYANGSASTPIYSWNSNPATGIFQQSSDVLGFSTNGVERLRIPNANQIHANNRGTAALPFYSFSSNDDLGMYSPTINALGFSTSGIERVRIDVDGDVGIGTSPNNSAQLDVSANDKGVLIPRVALIEKNVAAPITSPSTSLLVYNTATSGTAPNNVYPGFYYWSGSWIALAGSGGKDWSLRGNFGTSLSNDFIGTSDDVGMRFRTNNVNRFEISNDGFFRSFNNGSASEPFFSWSSDSNTGIFRPANDVLAFSTNGLERVRVASNGNVGVGTTNPGSILHIREEVGTNAGANNQGSLVIDHNDGGGVSSIVFPSAVNRTSDFGYIKYSDDGSGNGSTTENALLEIGVQNDGVGIYQDDIALMPTGNLGVDTRAPKAKFHNNGTTAFTTATSGANNTIILQNGGTFNTPTANVETNGRIYIIRNTSTSSNLNITNIINYSSASSANFALTPSIGSIMIVCDGTNWYRID